MAFLPSPEVLLGFTVASLLLIVTPGPDMTLFLGETLRGGRGHGFAAMLGASSGLLVHSLLAAFGLSAVLAASPTAFTVLKLVGTAYLLWLAAQAIRHGSALTLKRGDGARRSIAQSYGMGVAVNLLNPKIIVFFLTFLPQFISVSDPHASGKLLFLGLLYLALTIPTCALMIVAAERFTAALRRSPRIMRAVDWLFAGVMGAFAAKLMFTRGA